MAWGRSACILLASCQGLEAAEPETQRLLVMCLLTSTRCSLLPACSHTWPMPNHML